MRRPKRYPGAPIVWGHSGKEIPLKLRGFTCTVCGDDRQPVGRCGKCGSFAEVVANLVLERPAGLVACEDCGTVRPADRAEYPCPECGLHAH